MGVGVTATGVAAVAVGTGEAALEVESRRAAVGDGTEALGVGSSVHDEMIRTLRIRRAPRLFARG